MTYLIIILVIGVLWFYGGTIKRMIFLGWPESQEARFNKAAAEELKRFEEDKKAESVKFWAAEAEKAVEEKNWQHKRRQAAEEAKEIVESQKEWVDLDKDIRQRIEIFFTLLMRKPLDEWDDLDRYFYKIFIMCPGRNKYFEEQGRYASPTPVTSSENLSTGSADAKIIQASSGSDFAKVAAMGAVVGVAQRHQMQNEIEEMHDSIEEIDDNTSLDAGTQDGGEVDFGDF